MNVAVEVGFSIDNSGMVANQMCLVMNEVDLPFSFLLSMGFLSEKRLVLDMVNNLE